MRWRAICTLKISRRGESYWIGWSTCNAVVVVKGASLSERRFCLVTWGRLPPPPGNEDLVICAFALPNLAQIRAPFGIAKSEYGGETPGEDREPATKSTPDTHT